MSDYLELMGKRALVTGGTKGVGQAVVAALREAGATVLTTARSQPKVADMRISSSPPTSRPPRAVPWSPRLSASVSGDRHHRACRGGLLGTAGGFAVLDDHEWHKALDQNLFAAVRLDRALVPSMITQGSGVIVHITSIQRQLPLPDATIAYAAAKAALSNYSKALSKEVSPKGVRVVRVSPGWVETDGAVGLVEEIARKNRIDYEGARQMVMDSLGGIPIGRPAKPRKSRTWSRSSSHPAPRPSPARNT